MGKVDERQQTLKTLQAAAAEKDWHRTVTLCDTWLSKQPDDPDFQLFRGLALVSIGDLRKGRDALKKLTALEAKPGSKEQLLVCNAELALGVMAYDDGNKPEAESHLSRVLEMADESSDSEVCSVAVEAACLLAAIHEERGDKNGTHAAYRAAIDKSRFTNHPSLLDRAAYAALMLGFSIDDDDIQRMQTLNSALELAMRSRSENGLEIAKVAAGAMIPLGFTAHRHRTGKELQVSLEEKAEESDRANWFTISFKLDEAQYFLEQIRANRRYQKLMFFYLSAFLSSARSVTFHIQELLAHLPNAAGAKKRYRELRSELLSDPISKFFIERRNVSEKKGYPPVSFSLLKRHRDIETGQDIWTEIAHQGPLHITARELDSVESSLLRGAEPIFPGQGVPVSLEPRWSWDDYPGKSKEVVSACEEYLEIRVVDFTGHDLGALEQRLSQETGFEIDDHLLEFTGLCQACQEVT